MRCVVFRLSRRSERSQSDGRKETKAGSWGDAAFWRNPDARSLVAKRLPRTRVHEVGANAFTLDGFGGRWRRDAEAGSWATANALAIKYAGAVGRFDADSDVRRWFAGISASALRSARRATAPASI